MAFNLLDSGTKPIAELGYKHLKNIYGSTGWKVEAGIDGSIGWRPTFFQSNGSGITAFEVVELPYPESIRGSALDIIGYKIPITVYQICSIQVASDPKNQKLFTTMRDRGVGLITVDLENKRCEFQYHVGPLSQHISKEELKDAVPRALKFKGKIQNAYNTYQSNTNSGVQELSQIVEAIVKKIGKAHLTPKEAKDSTANQIEALSRLPAFQPHFVALGVLRKFVKESRNFSSHPPSNSKEAIIRVKKCKPAFFQGVECIKEIEKTAKALKLNINISL